MHRPAEAGHPLGRTGCRPGRRKRMTSVSCGSRSGAGEARSARRGAGRESEPTGELPLFRRPAVSRRFFDGPARCSPWRSGSASGQQSDFFPNRKTRRAAPATSVVRGERRSLSLFPYSKNFCTRLTDSRAPPSIGSQSAFEPGNGEGPTDELRRRCASEQFKRTKSDQHGKGTKLKYISPAA